MKQLSANLIYMGLYKFASVTGNGWLKLTLKELITAMAIYTCRLPGRGRCFPVLGCIFRSGFGIYNFWICV